MLEAKKRSFKLGNTTYTFETGKIARQANGAVTLQADDTIVFASACAAADSKDDINFFPLRVDYQEKFASAGKTLGGFIKREGRPAEREILVARLIDRPLRPMFPDGYFNEVQLLTYVWSYDKKHSPDVLAICAASAALTISDIPLVKPVGAVRVGRVEGQFVINPSPEQQKVSSLDLVLAGTEDGILMIEGFCDFLTEEEVLEAIQTGHDAVKVICHELSEWRKEIGREKNLSTIVTIPEDLTQLVTERTRSELAQAIQIVEKQVRDEAIATIKEKLMLELFPENEEPKYKLNDVEGAFKKETAKQMREMILQEDKRADGRNTRQVRQIHVEQHLLPRTHGSSLFTRGETQSMAICTLGGDNMAQRFEDLEGDWKSNFYMQYFFPPFSVGEVGRSGPAGRREIGHGKLAERALKALIPGKEKFPYTIRLESNITESNGSSSMASVCGGCLAMMDAGVPIERPIAGIAMGLILEDHGVAVLSDILGIEDALGDMDFKIAGDEQGITAFQMDIKVEGITQEIMKKALEQAKDGRCHILGEMLKACPKPREEMSSHAPRIATLQVHPSKIGTIIGPGGKQIRAIVEETGADIDIDDSGLVSIAACGKETLDLTMSILEGLVAEVEIGKTYRGRVVSIVPFGAFIEVLPGKEGLCHISELDHQRVEKVEDYLKEGELVDVKVLDINERGQMKLSRKALIEKPQPA